MENISSSLEETLNNTVAVYSFSGQPRADCLKIPNELWVGGLKAEKSWSKNCNFITVFPTSAGQRSPVLPSRTRVRSWKFGSNFNKIYSHQQRWENDYFLPLPIERRQHPSTCSNCHEYDVKPITLLIFSIFYQSFVVIERSTGRETKQQQLNKMWTEKWKQLFVITCKRAS